MAASQRAFILFMTTWGDDEGDVKRESNLKELNGLLDKGWTVAQIAPMSGHGEDDDETRSLIILERSK